MKSSAFKRRVLFLWVLLWFQRIVRLLLRAAWIGAGVYLILRSVNSLWGWIPGSNIWIITGAIVAGATLFGILYRWPQISKLTWRVDRSYELDEQVSTAWQAVQVNSSGQIVELLTTDANALLPPVKNRILLRGWFLGRDFVSALIVFSLFWMINSQNADIETIHFVTTQEIPVPAWEDEPAAEDIAIPRIPGMEDEQQSLKGEESDTQSSEEPGGGYDRNSEEESTENEAMLDALVQMGEDLSGQAVSYQVGTSLQNRDLNKAAAEMEILADEMEQLSPQTKQAIMLALQKGGEEMSSINNPGAEGLSESMEAATSAMQSGNNSKANDAMYDIAASLRDLGNKSDATRGRTTSESGQGDSSDGTEEASTSLDRERSASMSTDRLFGEGAVLELGGSDDLPSALNRGHDEELGSEVIDSTSSQVTVAGNSVITRSLVPYHFPWKWHDVVSAYFSPQ